MEELAFENILSTVIYGTLGFVLFAMAIYLMEKLTHFSIKQEIVEEHNQALAIVMGAMMIAMGLIISAAIH